jgi:hypothetical protein
MPAEAHEALIPVEHVASRILFIRSHKVMLDADLAELFGVTTKRLNEQVKRNRERFPDDFMFQLTLDEMLALNRSQIATGSQKHRDPRARPYAFTEHGAVMLSAVLNTPVAVQASILVVRAFIRLRLMITSNVELARRLADLERKYTGHDKQLKEIITLIRKLMEPPPEPPREPIGFQPSRRGK